MVKDQENPVLGRREVEAELEFTGATPSRKQVLETLASKLGVDQELVVIREIRQEFGKTAVTVFAAIYPDAKTAKKVEQPHLFARLEGNKSAQNK